VELDSPPPLSPADARRAREKSVRGATAPGRHSAGPSVTLYSADWCPYCHKEKAHLERRHIAFELRDVDVPAARAEMVAKSGQSGIPVLEVGGRIMTGYDPTHLDAFLDSAGFP